MKKIVLFLTIIGSTLSSFAQWYEVNSNTTENLKDIIMLDENIGYAVGGGDTYNYPNGGDGIILKTTDGGENWTLAFSEHDKPIYGVGVINDTIYGFANAIGEKKIIYSGDNGNSWQIENTPYLFQNITNSENAIYSIILYNSENHIKKMTGLNEIENIAENASYFGVNSNEIIYINDSYSSIYKSNDYGETFEELLGFPEGYYIGGSYGTVIKSFNDTIVLRCNYPASTHYSFDNGATWTDVIQENPLCEIITPYFSIGIPYGTKIAYTTDSVTVTSESWQIQTELSDYIRKVYVYNENLAFAIGENGMIYKTTNLEGLASNPQHTTKSGVKIVPNPSSNTLLLTNTEHLNIQSLVLYDTSGKKVKEYQTNTQEMDVSTLSSGTYLLRISTPKGTYTEKVVKN